jgi:hypothetical protein
MTDIGTHAELLSGGLLAFSRKSLIALLQS